MQSLIIVKLGGSVITDKSRAFCAKEKEIKRLGREMKNARKKYKGKIIIAHGSGSFGHFVANKYQTQKGLINKKSIKGMVETSDAAVRINKIVMENLIDIGLNVKSFSPASFISAKNTKLKKIFVDPIINTLEHGVVPVVFGDVVMDEKKGFCIYSAEKVIWSLVTRLHKYFDVKKIIYCSDTDGVYDSKRKTISNINSANLRMLRKDISGSNQSDVTGGMLHKVEESIKLATKYELKVYIINGMRKGSLTKAIIGDDILGTKIKKS